MILSCFATNIEQNTQITKQKRNHTLFFYENFFVKLFLLRQFSPYAAQRLWSDEKI